MQNVFSSTFLSQAFKSFEGIPNSRITDVFRRVARNSEPCIELPYPEEQTLFKDRNFLENLSAFSNEDKFQILDELSQIGNVGNINPQRENFRKILLSEYGFLQAESRSKAFSDVFIETTHFLEKYPKAKKKYLSCIDQFERNSDAIHLLDDLRKSVEFLMKEILKSRKSWNGLVEDLGKKNATSGISVRFRNMFFTLLKHFEEFQNEEVKHNELANTDAESIEFMFEITSAFLRFLSKHYS